MTARRVLVAAAALLLACVVGLDLDDAAPAAVAAAAGQSRIIYYSSKAPAGLWVMNADGKSPKSFLPGADGANFSVTGKKMVYQVGGSVACNANFGPGQIVAANGDGSKPVTLGSGCSPRISPDGTRVLYLGGPVNGSQEPLYVVRLSDPTHPHQILPIANCVEWVTHAYAKYPNDQSVCNFDQIAAWVGNDTIVVSGYQNGLWELPAAGGHPHPILSGEDQDSDWFSGLSVSPNGATIAGFPLSQTAQGDVLATVPAGGGTLKILYTQPTNSNVSYAYPQWLDNQTLIVQHTSGTPAHTINRIAVTPSAAFSAKDINPTDTTASFPALDPPQICHIAERIRLPASAGGSGTRTYKGSKADPYDSLKCQPDSFVAKVSGATVTVDWDGTWPCSSDAINLGIPPTSAPIGPGGHFSIKIDNNLNGTSVTGTITGVVGSNRVTITKASGHALTADGKSCDGVVENATLT